MNTLLKSQHPVISDLCRKHGVRRLYAFGSVVTSHFTEKSDVDLLVDFDKTKVTDYFTNFFDLKTSLEEAFGRDVDLVERAAITNPVFKRKVERTQTKIYG